MICKRAAWGVGVVVVIGLASLWLLPVDTDVEPPRGPQMPSHTWVEHVPVDGRLVTCVYYSAYGISCDWAGARPLDAGMTDLSIAAPAT